MIAKDRSLQSFFFLILLFIPTLVKADVSLLLHEAIGVAGEAGSAGHASIYFSNICADSPIRLRLCRPDELGVVITTYPNFGTVKAYAWLATPLMPFLYGVDKVEHIPIYTNGKIRSLLRETYRQRYWREMVPDRDGGALPPGHWVDLLANTFNRDVYVLTLKTTLEEDAAFVEKINRQSNENRFNTLYNNCADFARTVLNTYFPHATRRDPFNDLTMTTPKAIAKSLTRYAEARPERLFTITKYAQLAGPIRRSMDIRHYSEHGLLSKKYLAPMLPFNHIPIIYFVSVYLTSGYFDINRKYVEYATPEIAQINLATHQWQKQDKRAAQITNGDSVVAIETNGDGWQRTGEVRKAEERQRIFGTKEDWNKYKKEFAPLLQKAIADGLFADKREVKTFFKDLELQSTPSFDEQGALGLKVRAYGQEKWLGLTRGTILQAPSDPQVAYKLLLAKVSATLQARSKNRESWESFSADWELLHSLAERVGPVPSCRQTNRPRFLEKPEKTSFGHKMKMIFVRITH